VPSPQQQSPERTVNLVTLGCARNEVDSEELAARLESAGWTVADGEEASVVLVNTCGFIDAAKQESVSELLDAAASGAKVIAAGCLAERYGRTLAEELPEAEVLSFDDYADIGARLDAVLAGQRRPAHEPRDRRRLLPISPADRPTALGHQPPGHGSAGLPDLPPGIAPASGPRTLRRRLAGGPVAPLKIASGCDRRCSFCAIPSFRGLVLVSENSTSYGKDLGNPRLLDELLPALAAVPGIHRIRVSYLQPAEMRPALIEVLASTPGVAPYFDLSFQHASGRVLRAMRRFGDRERFGALLTEVRRACSEAGARSNFIVGFPGETEGDLDELHRFLSEASLDAIGVFGYSDEDGTEAARLGGQLDPAEIARRVDELAGLADEVMAQRAADRVGETVEVLIEEELGDGSHLGRAAHQAPEVDGTTTVVGAPGAAIGDLVRAQVTSSDGVDLVAGASAGRAGS
jgi:tRNA A37 methylthiotransferase MiaB